MRISVVVANHNYGFLVSKTITSLMSQSLPQSEYEVIVVDDASNDMSVKILEPYADSIRLLLSDSPDGHLKVCNEAFRRAKGQYIVRVDADDYVNRSFLEIEAMFLEENKGIDAVSCDYFKVDTVGNRLSRHYANEEPIACGVMIRREAMMQNGLYEESDNIWNDVEYLKRFRVYNIILPLYRYVQHKGSLTSGNTN